MLGAVNFPKVETSVTGPANQLLFVLWWLLFNDLKFSEYKWRGNILKPNLKLMPAQGTLRDDWQVEYFGLELDPYTMGQFAS